MSTNEPQCNKDPLADAPTPDRDIPGIVDLSRLSEGDTVALDTHDTPFDVVDTAAREHRCKGGDTTTQRAVALESTHQAGGVVELVEAINRVDGSVIEIVDRADETPVRLFRESADV
jgi:bifunctional ADP-heptose synthase (sugar kinase/adenylyltransferase)